MRYTVVWRPPLTEVLLEFSFASSDRERFSEAATRIEEQLAISPQTCGELRTENSRVVIQASLIVGYEVDDGDRLVNVISVRTM